MQPRLFKVYVVIRTRLSSWASASLTTNSVFREPAAAMTARCSGDGILDVSGHIEVRRGFEDRQGTWGLVGRHVVHQGVVGAEGRAEDLVLLVLVVRCQPLRYERLAACSSPDI